MSGRETEGDLVTMIGDGGPSTPPTDVRLSAKPAPAHIIKDQKRAMALNEWLVLERSGVRYRKGRFVLLKGGA